MNKRILLSTIPGPRDLVDGVDLYDIMAARLARGQGVFTPTAHAHCWALYLIAENLRAEVTVLENPTWEDFENEVRKGYDYFGTQLMATYFPQTVRMLEIVRSRSPETVTLAGGYGGLYLSDPPEGEYADLARRIEELTDHICREEGVRWFRRLIGDQPAERPIRQRFTPAGGSAIKGLEQLARARQPMVLAGLGCPNGCEFCATSAFFNRRKIRVTSAESLYCEMREHVLRSGNLSDGMFTIFDEDLFTDAEFVRELGGLIRSDSELVPHGGIRYFAFGSLRSLSQFTTEELAANGLATVWIGVESTFDDVMTSEHAIRKRSCDDVHGFIRDLQDHGIGVTASTILGWDFHTPENIVADIDAFVALEPIFYQVTPLIPCPGTRLYRRLQEDGRFLPGQDWSFLQYQDDEVMQRKNFAQGELRRYYDLALAKLYETNGPSQIRLIKLALNGHRKFKNSSDPYLRARARSHRQGAETLRVYLRACEELAPNEGVAQKARDVEAQCKIELGEMSAEQQQAALHLRDLLRERQARLDRGESEPVTYAPARWTTYRGDGAAPEVVRAAHDCTGAPIDLAPPAASLAGAP
ncbi:MAG: B12-binding domain-containing radical SAM protein [Myxococcota bacterium]